MIKRTEQVNSLAEYEKCIKKYVDDSEEIYFRRQLAQYAKIPPSIARNRDTKED